MNNDHILNKRQLRNSFERAAVGYDNVAMLQREVCDRMFSRLDYIKCVPSAILDAGSGTGYGCRKLANRYPDAEIMSLDLALAMLRHARPTSPWWKQILSRKNILNYVCGDIEQLPFQDSSIGMVWSNLTLQWCNDIGQTFAEVHRVLKPEGFIYVQYFWPGYFA